MGLIAMGALGLLSCGYGVRSLVRRTSDEILLQPGRSFYCLMREPGPGDPLDDARRKFNELKQWFREDRRNISSSIFLELAIFSNGDPAIALSGVWGALDSPGLPPGALDGWDLFVDGGISTVRKNEYLRRTSTVDSVLLWQELVRRD
jgi:hypothetical protein